MIVTTSSSTPAPPRRNRIVFALRLIAVAIALAAAGAILFAVGAIEIAKAHGVALVDALTAPVAFVVYAGPPLLAAGLATRSRTSSAAVLALAVAVLFAVGLEALRGTPWHSAHWREHADDAWTRLLLGSLLGAWPLIVGATRLWQRANRAGE
jgi:hypothetical protein